jgi:hypothetical protein
MHSKVFGPVARKAAPSSPCPANTTRCTTLAGWAYEEFRWRGANLAVTTPAATVEMATIDSHLPQGRSTMHINKNNGFR